MNTRINTNTLTRLAGATALMAGLVLAFAPAHAADKELKLKKVAAPVVVGASQPASGGGFSIKSVPPKAPAAPGSRQIAVEPKGLVAPKAPVFEAPKAPNTGVARIELPKASRPQVAAITPPVTTLTDAAPAPFAPVAPVAPVTPVAPQAEAAPAPVAPQAAPAPAAPVAHHNSYSAYYGHGGYYAQQPAYYGGYRNTGGYGGFRNCH